VLVLKYSERIQQAIDFIENNLTTAFTLEDVAKQANFSLFYFHRLFHAFTGLSLKGYIRRRRLSEAASALLSSRDSILEIALLYCYETPESFLRAFKKCYGQTPSEFRKQRRELFSFEKVSIPQRLDRLAAEQEFSDVVPKFTTIDKLDLAGISVVTTYDDEFSAYAEIWNKFYKLLAREQLEGAQLYYGLCQQAGPEQYRYLASINQDCLPQSVQHKLTSLQLPAGKWVVFNLPIAPERIWDAWYFIFDRFLPEINCDFTEHKDLEIYHRQPGKKINRIDFCIPVKA
jgi:AraC family transcriptional regulator